MTRTWSAAALAPACIVGALIFALPLAAGAPQSPPSGQPAPPVPRPFPGSSPATSSPTRSDAPAAAQAPAAEAVRTAPPDLAAGGAPVYPAAEFIESFEAGAGQRYYLYGSNTPYADIVAFYKNVLKNGGRELYKAPPMQQFDLGRFQENSMAYPPSVVVKDYTWNGSAGYLAVNGTTERRFKTVIQIVPVTAPR